ncbi:SDR family oxidoreductase [SAR92 clade bacterium H455]|uniref:SDR family oxidoreductase n=1 Tax=SAR92 clade bacterium H455 TaxID=2974818 RepID=A0ABY5TS45_9GAMM|nr:SDR family oxidoreductase [SAR92 clade bacterium H455]
MATYVLTGGATGIGAAIKARLKAAGHRVVVLDLRDADIEVDLSQASQRQAAIKALLKILPESIEGIITCAGVASHFPDLKKILSINYTGSVEIINGLRQRLAPGSSVVMVSSNSAPLCQKPELVELLLEDQWQNIDAMLPEVSGHDCYSGSKQAVAKWMRKHAPEFAGQGIRLNAIAPGYTETAMTKAVADDPQYGEAIRQFVASIPMQRAGSPEDMADAAEFLLSDKASFVAGSMLYIDGGHDAMFRPKSI